jgi:hypothetical protein
MVRLADFTMSPQLDACKPYSSFKIEATLFSVHMPAMFQVPVGSPPHALNVPEQVPLWLELPPPQLVQNKARTTIQLPFPTVFM